MSTRSPLHFSAWVLVLSVPIYVWGVVAPVRGLPFGLPATAIMIVVPAIVATWLTLREEGAGAAWTLWQRAGDVHRVRAVVWGAAALLVMPLATLAAYAAMRVLGLPLPADAVVPLSQAPLLLAIYGFGAVRSATTKLPPWLASMPLPLSRHWPASWPIPSLLPRPALWLRMLCSTEVMVERRRRSS